MNRPGEWKLGFSRASALEHSPCLSVVILKLTANPAQKAQAPPEEADPLGKGR